MPDPTPQQLVSDPRFHALPFDQRQKALAGIDPDFAKMAAPDQIRTLVNLGQRFAPPAQTFDPNQPALQPISKGPGAMERAGIPTSKQQLYDMATSGGDVPTALNNGNDFVAAQLLNAGKGVWHGLKSGYQDFEDAANNIKAGQPVLPNVGKMLYGGVQGAVGGLGAPVGGQQLMNFGEDIHTGNYAGAGGGAGSMMVQALLAHGMSKLPELAASRAQSVAASNTSKYATNLAGAIGEDSNKAINVPAEAGNVIHDVRQIAANEGITPADLKGANAAATVRNVIGKTLDAHEANYQQLLDSIRDSYVPMTVKARIQNAIGQEVTDAMNAIMPGDATAIRTLREKTHGLHTWEDLDRARQLMNRASQAVWNRPEAMQLNSPNQLQALEAGSNAIRDELYNEVGRVNGLSPDAIRALKLKEGSLLKLDAFAEGMVNKTSNAQAAHQSMNTWEKMRQGSTAYEAGKELVPFVGKMSPEKLVASKVARAFENLPAPNSGIGMAPNIANMRRFPQLATYGEAGGPYPMDAGDPGMTAGDYRAMVAQRVRQGQPLRITKTAGATGLPSMSTSLPDVTAMTPGERTAAIMQWMRENQARLTNQRALPAQAEAIPLPPSSY